MNITVKPVMIELTLDSINATPSEEQVGTMLLNRMSEDLKNLECPECQEKSEIVLHIDNSKMYVLRTEVKPCCKKFGEAIDHQLGEGQLA